MRNMMMSLLAVAVMTLSFGGPAFANSGTAKGKMEKSKVHLTQKQQKELSSLHKKMLKNKKEIISKYVEYGVMSKEKGEKIKGHMEHRFQMMERNGFVPGPHQHKSHKRDCR